MKERELEASKLTNHQVPPAVGESTPDTSNTCDSTGDEDSTTSAEVLVQRCCRPGSEEGAGEVWHGVDDSVKPFVPLATLTLRDTELGREEEVGAVDNTYCASDVSILS